MCSQDVSTSSSVASTSTSRESSTISEQTPPSDVDKIDESTNVTDTSTSAHPCEQNADSELVALHKSITLLSNSWMDVSDRPLTSVRLCKVSALPTVSTRNYSLLHCQR